MNKDQKILAEAYTEGVRKAVKGGALGAASGASKGAATTSWVPAIGPLAGVKAASTGVGAALGGLAGAKKGAALGGVGGAGIGAMMDDEDAENPSDAVSTVFNKVSTLLTKKGLKAHEQSEILDVVKQAIKAGWDLGYKASEDNPFRK